MRSLRFETIFDAQELRSFQNEWDVLFHNVDSASPFQSPNWLLTWWKYFARGDLRVLAMREADALVAVFPLYIEVKSSGMRELKCIGAGISDYLEPWIAHDHETICYEAFNEWLSESCGEWDRCVLEGLPAESKLFEHASTIGRRVVTEPCLRAQLPTNVNQWRRSISPKLNENIRYSWHRAQNSKPLRLHVATKGDLSESVHGFFEVHKARWAAEHPNLDSGDLLNFYHEIADRTTPQGIVRLLNLYWGEQLVAGVYGFVHHSTFYIHLTAYDPQFAKHSFGSLVINAAVERAIEEGCDAVDFLRGREAYKYRFGANEKAMATFTVNTHELRKNMAVAGSFDKLAT